MYHRIIIIIIPLAYLQWIDTYINVRLLVEGRERVNVLLAIFLIMKQIYIQLFFLLIFYVICCSELPSTLLPPEYSLTDSISIKKKLHFCWLCWDWDISDIRYLYLFSYVLGGLLVMLPAGVDIDCFDSKSTGN